MEETFNQDLLFGGAENLEGVKVILLLQLEEAPGVELRDKSGLDDGGAPGPELAFQEMKEELEAGLPQLLGPGPVLAAQDVEEDFFEVVFADEKQPQFPG